MSNRVSFRPPPTKKNTLLWSYVGFFSNFCKVIFQAKIEGLKSLESSVCNKLKAQLYTNIFYIRNSKFRRHQFFFYSGQSKYISYLTLRVSLSVWMINYRNFKWKVIKHTINYILHLCDFQFLWNRRSFTDKFMNW